MKIPIVVVALISPVLAYNMGGFRGYRRPMVVMPSPFIGGSCSPAADLLRQQQAFANRAFQRAISSPRYEITDNEEKFQIAVDVPGVKANDIDISIENDGQVLTLSGRREATGNKGYQYSSKFEQSFSLDPAIDVDQITASLQNGVLFVTCPKDFKRIEESIKKIPVTQVDDGFTPVMEMSDTSVEKPVEVSEKEVEDVVDTEIETKDDGKAEDESKDDTNDSAPPSA
jgi:HSP20 family protein